MKSIESVLTLWDLGLLSSDAVIAWADAQILNSSNPPIELIDLSVDGPEACLKRAAYEFSARPIKLSFLEEFSALALATDIFADRSALQFAEWAAYRALGEDLDEPFVMLSYRLFHLIDDCRDAVGATRLVQDELPMLIPRCESVAVPLLGQVPNNSFKPNPLRGSA